MKTSPKESVFFIKRHLYGVVVFWCGRGGTAHRTWSILPSHAIRYFDRHDAAKALADLMLLSAHYGPNELEIVDVNDI